MRASTLSAILMAAAALASPVRKREMVVEVDVVVTTVWVTSGQQIPTQAPSSSSSSTSKAADVPAVVEVSSSTSTSVDAPDAPTATTSTSTSQPPPPPTSSSSAPPLAQPSAAPSAASGPAGTDYISQILFHHNAHRANHSASALTWDAGLAATAGKTASTCVWAHDTTTDAGNGGYGQNLAAGTLPENIGEAITIGFYNNEVEYFKNYYGQSDPPTIKGQEWGHFSQVVWKATSSIGCATQHCPGGLAGVDSSTPPYFTVCNYKQFGNVAHGYGDNVGEPLGHPYMSGN
ncbi:MAG: hypothetical protein M1829_001674 [Trizodia sp. TS-e1964]|nr:MAG: hypothetical protein M1829_001674 [Trizodia sp. TS-e1964]